MQMKLSAPGFRYTELIEPKFRSCMLLMRFYVPRDPKTAPVHALLTDLLTASSAEYPGPSALCMKLDSLYAAEFSARLMLCGDGAALSFSASWLNDRFALEQEDITGEMLRLVTNCLLHPNVQQNAFCDPEFRICKQNLLDDIDCERNDKRIYALQRAATLSFAGSPAAISPCGSRTDAEAVTPELAYQIWQEILQTAPVDIICVLPEEKPVRAALNAAFSGLNRRPAEAPLWAPVPRKQQPLRCTEYMTLNQCKLVMLYQCGDIPYDILYLINSLLGGINNSMLFLNVREAQGLCYYCISSFSLLKGVLTIDCGVQEEDLAEAEKAVHAQIKLLQRGAFPDSMLQEAILDFQQQHAVIEAESASVAARAASSHLRNDNRSPEEIARALAAVSKAQIAEAAKQLLPDTVYILRAREEAAPA